MSQEDEEFNRIERESKMRMEAVHQEVQKRNKAVDKEYAYERGVMRGRELKRTWVGLTDEETAELVHRYAFYNLVREVEAKLKERNT